MRMPRPRSRAHKQGNLHGHEQRSCGYQFAQDERYRDLNASVVQVEFSGPRASIAVALALLVR